MTSTRMAHLQRSVVTLRICGDDLVPEAITASLGNQPTFSQTKGDEIVGKSSGKVRIAKAGMWRLCATTCEPEDIDGQVRELLSKLTDDLRVWREIQENCQLDLFCGLFMGSGNEGVLISPQTLVALGERGIQLGLDIYDSDND